MVLDFTRTPAAEPLLPAGFFFVPWSPDLTEPHADVLHRSFRNDLDGTVFTSFRQYGCCCRLIESVAVNPFFLPEATLMIARGGAGNKREYAAGIQGLKLSAEVGAIQNVSVLPEFRRCGIGNALVLGALQGFRQAGVSRVTLEATADNLPAAKLYHRIGFTVFRTYFREIFD